MTTAIQLLDRIRKLLDSGLDDETAVASCRALINAERDEDGDWMLLERSDAEVTLATAIDEAFDAGWAMASGQEAANLQTVAAQRDELATKLHAIGKARLKMSDQERRRAGADWLRDEFRLHDLPPQEARRWIPRDQLPARGAWCDVLSADGQHTAIAHWDGDAFILMRRRRLVEGEKWALRA